MTTLSPLTPGFARTPSPNLAASPNHKSPAPEWEAVTPGEVNRALHRQVEQLQQQLAAETRRRIEAERPERCIEVLEEIIQKQAAFDAEQTQLHLDVKETLKATLKFQPLQTAQSKYPLPLDTLETRHQKCEKSHLENKEFYHRLTTLFERFNPLRARGNAQQTENANVLHLLQSEKEANNLLSEFAVSVKTFSEHVAEHHIQECEKIKPESLNDLKAERNTCKAKIIELLIILNPLIEELRKLSIGFKQVSVHPPHHSPGERVGYKVSIHEEARAEATQDACRGNAEIYAKYGLTQKEVEAEESSFLPACRNVRIVFIKDRDQALRDFLFCSIKVALIEDIIDLHPRFEKFQDKINALLNAITNARKTYSDLCTAVPNQKLGHAKNLRLAFNSSSGNFGLLLQEWRSLHQDCKDNMEKIANFKKSIYVGLLPGQVPNPLPDENHEKRKQELVKKAEVELSVPWVQINEKMLDAANEIDYVENSLPKDETKLPAFGFKMLQSAGTHKIAWDQAKATNNGITIEELTALFNSTESLITKE